MPASIEPPLAVVSIGHERDSHGIVARAKEFVINVPTVEQLDLVRVAGTISGRDRDKFEGLGLTPEPSVHLEVPRVAECPAHVECRLVRRHRCGDHSLFVGEVVGAFATKEFFDGRLRVEGAAKTLHHLGGSHFHLPGSVVEM
jgi:flavin reductase (DIM6/NTAB) family NADH-FMN oxidoreductase RutF